jgi:hypothetical protein
VQILEAFLTGTAGATLGWLVGWPLDVPVLTASLAGCNGLVSGVRGVYNWRTAAGWFGFLLDSTWGMLGTVGSLALHIIQVVLPSRRYRPDLSRRLGRHVYEGGFRLKPQFATAVGNVISNAGGTVGLDGNHGPRRRRLIDRHEMLHVWQHRFFGPLFPLLYSLWFVLGAIAGAVIAVLSKRSIGKSVLTVAYYDNPFEYWAYRRDGYWPPAGAETTLAWHGGTDDQRTGTIL